MIHAVIFDIDGTLIDSVDLHALAWHEAFAHFGHDVPFEEARSQIGKGGDNLLPVFLSETDRRDHGDALEAWRGEHFKAHYLSMVRPFSAVPELFHKLRNAGVKLAVGSSAKKDELDLYLDLAGVKDMVDVKVSSEDVDRSKPAPDVFDVTLERLQVDANDAIVIGDSPYDATAAEKSGIRTVGLLSGAFSEHALREAGCIAIYPGPASLFACLEDSPLSRHK